MIDKCRTVNICYCLHTELYTMCIIFMAKTPSHTCTIHEHLVQCSFYHLTTFHDLCQTFFINCSFSTCFQLVDCNFFNFYIPYMGYEKRRISKYYMKSNRGGTACDWGQCHSQRGGAHTLTTTQVPRGTRNTSMDVA